MEYKSTRNANIRFSASQVIAQGISEEGGLFVPTALPDVREMLPRLANMEYQELAIEVFGLFLADFSKTEIENSVKSAYSTNKFGSSEPVKLVPLTKCGQEKYLLELWHGPTCAFKDMALQILPYFLTMSLKKFSPGREAVILVATSGDTGKAALEGFRDVPGTRVIVFYPQNGVSPMQKRQMATQEGKNVTVCAIKGNFDDAQTAVKKIFTDPDMKKVLDQHGIMFSSANSINIGRLLPQVVYYFYAYFKLCHAEKLTLGQPMNIVVPTGNFGNILAAYYAKRMGLPVKKFICASNANKVLTDFIRTGVYNRKREFYATASPSMDILISSNLERLLYALSGDDSIAVSKWMEQLSATGSYDVGSVVRDRVQELFFGGFCGDQETEETIRETWKKEGYLCDTHTAVALNVYQQYMEETDDTSTPTVVASTASPYKFVDHVLGALEATGDASEFENIARLEEITGTPVPVQLKALKDKPVRFTDLIEKDQAAEYVLKALGRG